MYKAIIIDDEDTIRQGLRCHFDWELHGVCIVEDFPDCAKAYDYIQEHPVELVITDVYTPYMDGITLAKKLRAEYPSIQVVFISGHADLELLKEALKTSAIDYILKTVDLDELSDTITRVVKLLDKRSQEKQQILAMEQKLQELLPLNRENYLRSLLYGENDQLLASYLGLKLDGLGQYICLVIRLTNKWTVIKSMNSRERLAVSLDCERLCSEALFDQPGSVAFKNRTSEFIVLLKINPANYEQDVLEVSSRIQSSLKDHLNLESAIGVGTPSLTSDLKSSYEAACEAIAQHYYLAEDSFIAVKKYTEPEDLRAAREFAAKHLPDAILSGDSLRVKQVLDQAFGYLHTMSEEEQDNFMLFLLLLPTHTLTGLKVPRESPYRRQRQLIEHWLDCPSRVEQEQFLLQVMSETVSLLRETSTPGSSTIIRQIQTIIEEQYMEQLSVASLAEQIHLTPTYLCVLFKQATGKTINEYLTDQRIHQAKLLLQDPGVKLQDVCYRVGYLSPSYFSKLFKKQTGTPPSEYRSKAQGDPPTEGNT